MAVIEKSGLMKYKDEDGNVYLMLPVTTKDNVDGMEEIDDHLIDQDNPHNVTWEQLPDKPFYEEEAKVVLEEMTMTFDPEMDNGWQSTSEIPLEVGKKYKIMWNGTEYECEAYVMSAPNGLTGIGVGNQVALGGADTGEPFVIGKVADELVEMAGGMRSLAIAIDGTTEAIVSIVESEGSIKKLDNKFLDLDWIPKKVVNKHYLVDEMSCECTEDESDGYYIGRFAETEFDISGLNFVTLEETETQITRLCLDQVYVNMNGVEYLCPVHYYFLKGDGTLFGLGNLNNTGDSTSDYGNHIPFSLIGGGREGSEEPSEHVDIFMLGSSVSGTNTFSIYTKEESDNLLPNKFLPEHLPVELDPTIVEVLPQTTFTLEDNQWFASGLLEITAGETYTVTWDGVEYNCVAMSGTMNSIAVTYLGNAAIMQLGDDTGEPFVFGSMPSIPQYGAAAADNSEHTIKITRIAPGEIRKLDSKYLDLDWVPKKMYETYPIITDQTVSNGYNKNISVYNELKDYSKALVVYDGVEYICDVALDYDSADQLYMIRLGNIVGAISGQWEDNKEPFFIQSYEGKSSGMYVYPKDPSTTHTISVSALVEKDNTIPTEFLGLDWVPKSYTPVLMPETTLQGVVDDAGTCYGTVADLSTLTVYGYVGKKIDIVVDGEKYTYTIKTGYQENDGVWIEFGNKKLRGANTSDTDEPFFLFSYISDTVDGPFEVYFRDAAPHTMAVYLDEEITETLPLKFLPEHLPSVNSAVIYPETTFTPVDNMYLIDDTLLPLSVGDTYIVTWDGTEYECICANSTFQGMNSIGLGNASIYGGGEDTGEPFAVGVISTVNKSGFITTDNNEHTISISAKNPSIRKLDSKFLDLDWIPKKVENKTYLLEEMTATGEYTESLNVPVYATTDSLGGNTVDLSILDYDQIYMTVNGVEYLCPIWTNYVENDGAIIVIGNPWFVVGDAVDNGMPFTLFGTGNTLDTCDAWTFIHTTSATNTFSVYAKEYSASDNPIPVEFLPDYLPAEFEPITVEIYPETTFTTSDNMYFENVLVDLKVGETYTVTWDGVEYECVAKNSTFSGYEIVGLGNESFYSGGENTGEPFGFGVMASIPQSGFVTTDENEHTAKITQTAPQIRKLDNKFLDLEWVPSKTYHDIELIPEQTISFSGSQNTIGVSFESLNAGNVCAVYWNGTEYRCIVSNYKYGFFNMTLGNLSLVNSEFPDTGEPFLFTWYSISKVYCQEFVTLDKNTSDPESITVKVVATIPIYNKIPTDHLPEKYIIPTNLDDSTNGDPNNEWRAAQVALNEGRSVYAHKGKATGQVLSIDTDAFDSYYSKLLYWDPTGLWHYSASLSGNVAKVIPHRVGLVEGGTFAVPVINSMKAGQVVVPKADVNVYGYCTEWEAIDLPFEFDDSGEISSFIIKSSTSGSTKRFKITVDDSGALNATEITE